MAKKADTADAAATPKAKATKPKAKPAVAAVARVPGPKPAQKLKAKLKKAPGKYEAKRAQARAKKPERTVTVVQIGSPLGRRSDQREQLIGLGLNKLHRSRTLEDTPAVRGMIYKVRHLVKVEESA